MPTSLDHQHRDQRAREADCTTAGSLRAAGGWLHPCGNRGTASGDTSLHLPPHQSDRLQDPWFEAPITPHQARVDRIYDFQAGEGPSDVQGRDPLGHIQNTLSEFQTPAPRRGRIK